MSSFSNPSVALPTSQLIIQPFRHFTYSLHPSVALPTSQLILQPFRCFTYVTAHSPTLPSLYLRHSSFSNPSVALPTSQLILQPFFCFSYVKGSSLTSPGEPPMVILRFSLVFPYQKFLFHHFSTLDSSISFHFVNPFDGVTALLFTGLQYSGFIASHPSSRPCIGHELRMLLYFSFFLL